MKKKKKRKGRSGEFEALVASIQSSLRWKLTIGAAPSFSPEMVSHPETRTHELLLPSDGSRVSDYEYIHELAHAYVAERHHYLLGTAYFHHRLSTNDIGIVVEPYRVAADWFADSQVGQWCPSILRREVADFIESFKNFAKSRKVGIDHSQFYGFGLFTAQGIHRLSANPAYPSELKPVVEAFLATDPLKPSLAAMEELINRLMAVRYSTRIRLAYDGMDVWDIIDGSL